MYLERFVNNPFADIRVGIERREKFVHYHILRMQGNNPGGKLDNSISETLTIHQLLTQNLSLRKYVAGSGKGSTLSLKIILKEFIGLAGDLESMCKIKFKKKTPIFMEVFPKGITEYLNVNQANFSPLLERLQQFSDKYKADVGIDFKDKFLDIKTRFEEKLSIKEELQQQAKGAAPDFEIIWNKLAKQLFKNTLTILMLNLDNPNILLSYFDQRIVNHRYKTIHEEKLSSYQLKIAPASFKAAGFSFSADDILLVMNNGNVPIFCYGAATTNEAPGSTTVEIPVGEEAKLTAVSLGAPANKYLMILNNANAEAKVEIAVL